MADRISDERLRELINPTGDTLLPAYHEIEAMARELLAAREQHPVAWRYCCVGCEGWHYSPVKPVGSDITAEPLYSAPPATAPDGYVLVPREPKPGLLCGDVAVSTDPRYAGWVFVRHVDGENWTTGAKLTPETWGMIAAAQPGREEK